jgi:hypothetical protein
MMMGAAAAVRWGVLHGVNCADSVPQACTCDTVVAEVGCDQGVLSVVIPC